jgi:hypothetical protein
VGNEVDLQDRCFSCDQSRIEESTGGRLGTCTSMAT